MNEPMPPETHRPKVLLVDDNVDFLTALQELVEDKGFSVFAATNSEDALQIAANEQPHFAVVDIHSVGASGIDVARGLKAACGGDLLILGMTGAPTAGVSHQARAVEMVCLIGKPFTADDLVDLLRTLRPIAP